MSSLSKRIVLSVRCARHPTPAQLPLDTITGTKRCLEPDEEWIARLCRFHYVKAYVKAASLSGSDQLAATVMTFSIPMW